MAKGCRVKKYTMQVKTDTYEGKKLVECTCEDCPKFRCFTPHNINRGQLFNNGKKMPERWVCTTNRKFGCPEVKELKTR
jgi:hypothetical protein